MKENAGAHQKARIAILMPGGVAERDEELHIPALYDIVSRLSKTFDITVFSLVAFKERKKEAVCGEARIKFVDARYNDHWTRKTWKLYQAFARDHRKREFSAIHGMLGLPSELATVIAGKVFGIKKIVSLIGGELASIPGIDYGNMRNQVLQRMTLWMCGQADILTVLTHFQKNVLNHYQFKHNRIYVIPFGVDIKKFCVSKETELQPPYRFIHVASQTSVKDQTTLLVAFATIVQHVEASLEIIGPDYMNGANQRTAIRLGLENHVIFRGSIPHTDLPQHYQKAHIMLHTSLYEAQAVVVAEAAASGVVVAGTNVGLISDFGDEGAVVAPIGNHSYLARGVLQLLADPTMYQKIRAVARKWAKHHDLSWTVDQFAKIYINCSE
jgi:glycosyltransferase involved in cell wall biosynthesis